MSLNIIKNDDPNYRYKMPKMIINNLGSGNGKKTIISNISSVADSISHPKETILKYFAVVLGTNSNVKEDTIKGWHNLDTLTDFLYQYIEYFIICPKCKSPETHPLVVGKKKNKKLQLNCSGTNCQTIISMNNKNFQKGSDIIIKYIENNNWEVKKGNMVLDEDDDEDSDFNPFD